MAHSICPWWAGYLLASPIRRWLQNPEEILRPHLSEGMMCLEVGPGMGFFTLPMARLVGSTGKVVAVDVQPKMISALERRAKRRGLADRLECRVCSVNSLEIIDLSSRIDFAVVFAVLHEIPTPETALAEIAQSLKPGGSLLFAEPSGHVKPREFESSIAAAQNRGLHVVERLSIKRCHSVLFRK